MNALSEQGCTACRKGAPPVSDEQIARYLDQLPDWQLIETDSVKRLQKVYKFKNFAQALQFTDRVGAVSEQEGHHLAILTEWGQVTVSWWTHAIGGLHENDFIMAAKTDDLL